MPPEPGLLPEPWRKSVLRLLEKGRFGRDILVPNTTARRWESESLGAFLGDVRAPLVTALAKAGANGLHIPKQQEREPGDTYAFWMFYRNRRFFAKICLHPGGLTIKLLSAHLPDRGDELYPTD